MNKLEKRIMKYQTQQSASKKFEAKERPYGEFFGGFFIKDNSNGIRKIVNKIVK